LATSNNFSVPADTVPASNLALPSGAVESKGESSQTGILILNADDWGRNVETTDRILECVLHGSVSSASAMVFMEDSERAAALARGRGVDVGLHLNFTTPFSAPVATGRLTEHHERVSRFLLRSRLSQVVYHPGLANSFEYVVAAQLAEFRRIYDEEPRRLDGHHHMHLCANVLLRRLLPSGTIVRRNFSFQPGEKSGANRLYRAVIDRILAKRHRLTDFFFSLPPLEPADRLQRIFCLARRCVVELETHPVNPQEYLFLTGGKILTQIARTRIATGFDVCLRSAFL
jgi:chitin disaccharide deacetylase